MMRRTFFSNSGDFRFALVFRTESDTRSPHAQAIFEKTFWQRQWREPSLTVYEFHQHCTTAGAAMVIPFRINTRPACKDSVRTHCSAPRLKRYSPMLRTVTNAVETIATR